MYNTVKEMHIALDMGLQHIDSNRKQAISPEHKDMALNYAVLQFVETRSNPKTNIKREGYEDTQKRYDDLRELKRSVNINSTYNNGKVSAVLPHDYYKLVSIGANVVYSKYDLPDPSIGPETTAFILKFPDDSATGTVYNNFKITDSDGYTTITIFDIANYPKVSTFHSSDAKFMIVNLVLEHINSGNDRFKVYWENWNDLYVPESFIFIGKKNLTTYTLSYSLTTTTSEQKAYTYKYYPSSEGTLTPVDLFSSEDEFNIMGNHYYQKNKHLNPAAYIERNKVVVYNGNNFVIPSISLVYLKKPRLINFKAGQSCEITVNREIIDLAIQKLKAYIKDEGYQHIVNESQIIE